MQSAVVHRARCYAAPASGLLQLAAAYCLLPTAYCLLICVLTNAQRQVCGGEESALALADDQRLGGDDLQNGHLRRGLIPQPVPSDERKVGFAAESMLDRSIELLWLRRLQNERRRPEAQRRR